MKQTQSPVRLFHRLKTMKNDFRKERKENNLFRKVQWVIKNDAASRLHRFFNFADPSSTGILLKGDAQMMLGAVKGPW